MPYVYDALHGNIKHVEDTEDAFEDAIDERGVLRDGKRVRVPFMMRDSSAPTPGAKMWHGEAISMMAGDSAPPKDGNVQLVSRQEMADFDKAQLSARWKGGLAEGDTFRLGDKLMVVAGRNPDNGKVQLRDASTSTADGNADRQAAYMQYDAEIQSRYLTTHDARAGDRCETAGREQGTWRRREKDGKLVCVVGGSKSSKENEIAGPLSDAEMVRMKDEMYASYDNQIQNAWRK